MVLKDWFYIEGSPAEPTVQYPWSPEPDAQGHGLWTVCTLLLLLGTDWYRCAGRQAWSQAGYCGGMAVTAADALKDRICCLPAVTAMDTLAGRVDSCPGWLESLAATAMGMVMCGADLLKREMLWGALVPLLRPAWWVRLGP